MALAEAATSRDALSGPSQLFSAAQVGRARRYHRPLYAARAIDTVLGASVLAVWAMVGASWLDGRLHGLGWAGRTAVVTAAVIVSSELVRLPLACWRGWSRERRWGFSTQTLGAFLADRAKGLVIAVVLCAAGLIGLVGLARHFPSLWPLPAAAGAAAFVLGIVFLAPLLLEPLFNRFGPLPDRELASELRRLAERAGAPIRDVLVADASRRTRKVNAYVSGVGVTRRVVLFDTLLDRGDPREIRVVVAHELGHRRRRHVLKSTVVGMATAVAGVAVVWALVPAPASPHSVPLVLLVFTGLQLVLLPVLTALSRRWEREADCFSLDTTEDPEAFERAHRELAEANLSDLDPPRALYLLLFTHPTPAERLEAARTWAARRAA